MPKKKKETLDEKAERITANIMSSVDTTKYYGVRDDISNSDIVDALIDYMKLVVKFHKKDKLEEYNKEEVLLDTLYRDYMSLQNLCFKEGDIDDVNLRRPELWVSKIPSVI